MLDALLILHRWVALIATILILVVAITGSALVFEGAIDRGLHPELWRVSPSDRQVSLDSLVANAHAAVPGPPVTGINLSPAADRADVASAGANQIFVNPYTGAVLGHRTIAEWNATLPRRLHVLHVNLMSGKTGGSIVGIVTCFALFLVVTGVVVWWRDKLWRIRWSASWKRIIFDLHHSLGIVAAVVITTIALSGMFIHYETLNKWMYSFDRASPPDALDQSEAPAGTRPISLDSIDKVATHALPGARVMFLSLPPKADQPFVAAMRFPEDHTPGGRSRVLVDRFNGDVLLVTSTREAQLGSRIGNQIRSIHTGDVFGKPTEMIWLAAAIVLALQGLTGVTMWWNARRSRAALARAKVAPVAALLIVFAAVPASAQLRTDRPFVIGERAEYDVRYGILHAGSASLSVVAIDTVRDRDAFRFRLTLSAGVNLLLVRYSLRDTMQSWVDTATFHSLRFHQDQFDGGRRRTKRYEIFPDRRVYIDGTEPERPSVAEPLDEIALLFFARMQSFEVGSTRELHRYFKPGSNPVVLQVIGRDTIEAAGRRWSTIIVRPIIKTSTMFSKDAEARAWIADDSTHVIVQLNTKVKFGSITMKLTSYESPMIHVGSGATKP